MNPRHRLVLIGILVAVGAGLLAYAYWAPHAPRSERAARGGSSGAAVLVLLLAATSARRRRRRREEEGRNG